VSKKPVKKVKAKPKSKKLLWMQEPTPLRAKLKKRRMKKKAAAREAAA
jgi:hypothetical protein